MRDKPGGRIKRLSYCQTNSTFTFSQLLSRERHREVSEERKVETPVFRVGVFGLHTYPAIPYDTRWVLNINPAKHATAYCCYGCKSYQARGQLMEPSHGVTTAFSFWARSHFPLLLKSRTLQLTPLFHHQWFWPSRRYGCCLINVDSTDDRAWLHAAVTGRKVVNLICSNERIIISLTATLCGNMESRCIFGMSVFSPGEWR